MKKSYLSEKQLISLLKTKDKKAFEVLYDRYGGCMYNVIYKIVHCKELTEDVLQDSFIKIWLHISTYDCSKGSLFTFLLNIARNTAIDKTRALAYKNRSFFSSLDLNTAEHKSYTTHPRDWQQSDFIGMDRFISQLSPTHRAIVELIYIQGYTHEQAATMLHIPVGTVKSKLKVAITQLRGKVL
jgi:RNA polymerase sigma-70 factor (ECF subfamily)